MSNGEAEYLEVVDPQLLMRLVRDAVEEHGNPSAAARNLLGLSSIRGAPAEERREWDRIRTQIGRLMSPETCPQRIAPETGDLLQRLIPSAKHDGLRQAVIGGRALAVVQMYRAWVEDTLHALLEPDGVPALDAFSVDHQSAILRKLEELEVHLRSHPDTATAFTRFDTAVEKAGHSADRHRLAIRRALRPLLDSEYSGGLELSWREMDGRDLRRFVRASLQRELVLLQRTSGVQRAQEVASELGKLVGREWRFLVELAASGLTLADPRSWTGSTPASPIARLLKRSTLSHPTEQE